MGVQVRRMAKLDWAVAWRSVGAMVCVSAQIGSSVLRKLTKFGSVAVSRLFSTFRLVKPVIWVSVVGMSPPNWLLLSNKTVKLVMLPICAGIGPLKRLRFKY